MKFTVSLLSLASVLLITLVFQIPVVAQDPCQFACWSTCAQCHIAGFYSGNGCVNGSPQPQPGACCDCSLIMNEAVAQQVTVIGKTTKREWKMRADWRTHWMPKGHAAAALVFLKNPAACTMAAKKP